jgi:hypothetical protein
LLLRSLWLGVGEILLGGVLAFILIKRIQKDDCLPEREKAAQPGTVESCALAERA